MPRGVILSPRAQAWLDQQIAYLTGRGSAAAIQRLLGRIEDARRLLAEHPRSGRLGTVPGTRRIVIAPYILIYRERGEDLDIIDIRHSRQRETQVE
jgi:plasmid stabilization system protein ParE